MRNIFMDYIKPVGLQLTLSASSDPGPRGIRGVVDSVCGVHNKMAIQDG